MDPSSIVVSEFIKFIFKKSEGIKLNLGTSEVDVFQRLSMHLRFVDSWSSTLHIIGMTHPENIDEKTIDLRISEAPRKFRSSASRSGVLSELDLVISENNIVLLGDPGSGKTTTFQRICRIILTRQPLGTQDSVSYPLVVRGRQIAPSSSFKKEIAKIIGVSLDDFRDDGGSKSPGGKNLDAIICDFLDLTNAAVLFDGLDEVDASIRREIQKEIEDCAAKTSSCRFLISCRSGDYNNTIQGFHIVEILPLASKDVKKIVRLWSRKPADFTRDLEECVYKDTINRPLFLNQLIQIHNQIGNLPPKPSEVYRRIIMLVLEKWDTDRDIIRKSKYSSFGPDQKKDFLASLAFHLTYKLKKKDFNESDLIEVYNDIAEQFDLPLADASQVARELESHSGIVIETIGNRYEFCHLSLQEYLAADYIVRSAQPENIKLYMESYQAPMAIAVALSSDPSVWISNVILRSSVYIGDRGSYNEKIVSLISRINIERPNFVVKELLGLAILKMISDSNQLLSALPRSIIDFIMTDVSLKSVSRAMRRYYIDRYNESPIGFVNVVHRDDVSLDTYYAIPEKMTVDSALIRSAGKKEDHIVKIIHSIETELPGSGHIATMVGRWSEVKISELF